MKSCLLRVMLVLYLPLPYRGQRLVPPRSYQDDDDDHDDQNLLGEDRDVYQHRNWTDEKGLFVGAPCEHVCSSRLQHAYCNLVTNICECEKKYPVRLSNPYSGCSKPKSLGEQCYYHETCEYTDQHASCIQVHHNAICQCQTGYHAVSLQKPSKRTFCAEDAVVVATDFSTFAGVLSGIAILSGLICFVLHLFNQNLYGSGHRRHRFGNANLAPPILFSSDPGSLPLPIMVKNGGTQSQASSRRTFVSSMASRRTSSAATYHRSGIATVPGSRAGNIPCRFTTYTNQYTSSNTDTVVESMRCMRSLAFNKRFTGSRRPSIASVHSSNSIRSYSARRYEREREQKEEREMQRRLSKMATGSMSIGPPTPSPHSTDDLLPTLKEDVQAPPLATKEDSTTSFQEENLPSTSRQYS
ncbi:uncharacterized protein LOC132701194 isoform X2 [Cylas formicarius]|uniref:uncharacterized protein LOC132701194 isoform X2 n=1 Tax=Cylas formicarius TaxID=197179 RepID=UPI002958B5C4|nr:uncharacterized protein LOC132701194 isoform X2 [Cylas formicarius]